MKYLYPLIIIVFLPLLPSCSNGSEESDAVATTQIKHSEILITRQQFESGGMELGDPNPHNFQQSIKANAYVAPSESGWAKVSPPISGQVKKIYFKLGDPIKKGQLLFTIESNEIIKLQQQYAESCARLNSIRKSYDRQKALSEENVSSEKELLKAESEYKGALTKIGSLKAQLELINIDPLKVEDGHIGPSASIYSPIKGFITDNELVLGKFISPGDDVLEIVDSDLLQLHINVFERDLKNLDESQEVFFYSPNRTDELHQAVLTQLGKSIDEDTKTVRCVAQIFSDKKDLVNGLFVETEIITCNREALAIPAEAFIEEDGFYYLLELQSEAEDKMYFKKIPVKLGVIQGEYGEILEDGLRDILLKGGYNILAQE